MSLTAPLWSAARRRAFTFARCREGIAAIEFALSAPIFVLLFLGTLEMSNYLMVAQKTEKISSSIADMVSQTQQTALTNSQMSQIMIAATELIKPLTFTASGRVIVSSIYKDGTNSPRIIWRYTHGSLSQNSKLGNVNAVPTLPSGFTLQDKDNIIVTEVYYSYTNMYGLSVIPTNTLLYRISYYKPRLGTLTQAPS